MQGNWRVPKLHQEQTEDNESRFLIVSPVPCSRINSNYTTVFSQYLFRIYEAFSKNLYCARCKTNNNCDYNEYIIVLKKIFSIMLILLLKIQCFINVY